MWYGQDNSRHPTVTEKKIAGFFDDYRFLSNFHPCPVTFEGRRFLSAEAAYMSAKNDSDGYKDALMNVTKPSVAKAMGRQVKLVDNWDTIKVLVMTQVVTAKFFQNEHLARALLNTGHVILEETNDWNDRFWGADIIGNGENMLGKILMHTRDLIRWAHWWEHT